MATATKTKRLDVDTAEKRVRETAAEAERLKAESEAGDQSISPAQIRTADTAAEDAAWQLKSARAAEAKREAEDIEQRGAQLHAEWVTDVLAAVEAVEDRILGFQKAAGALLDSLETHSQLRNGYKSRWNEVFRGNTELPSALKFKAGGTSGGDFGALNTPYQVARNIDPVQLIVAVLGEVLGRGTPSNTLSGWDRDLQRRLNQTPYRQGLLGLRELRKQLVESKETKT